MSEPKTSSIAANLPCDVVIVGCGVAGLYTALKLPRALRILMLSKGALEECDSMLAQGGICVMLDEDDYAPYFEDTMRAGHYENRAESVDAMLRASRRVIDDLIARGVRFERTENGELAYTREGAHSRPRICYHADTTGKEITEKLLACVQALPNVEIMEHTTMVDLLENRPASKSGAPHSADGTARIAGVVAERADGARLDIRAQATVLATGGIGGLYEHSTNYPLLTGDGCRIAAAHGAELEHMDYVQIHPTSLYRIEPGRSFLISESCRGEGAVLLDARGNRFTDELQPRDVVTAAIRDRMEHDGTDHVRLSFERIDRETILRHFPHIYETCLEAGYDITCEPIPVVPAQHYFMGGVHVDLDSATTLPGLWAVGETSCNGVHGKNRLASNSLLEALVFAERAAYNIATGGHLAPGNARPVDASSTARSPRPATEGRTSRHPGIAHADQAAPAATVR